MEIQIEDLNVGDEILISTNSKIKYLRVLEKPRLSKKKRNWRTKALEHIAVECSTNVEEITSNYIGWKGQPSVYKYDKYHCTPHDHNLVKKFNLNNRTIWLVKKADLL